MRCEGWIRNGGAFTLGPVKWEQCDNKAAVMVKFKRKGQKAEELPACNKCWQKLIEGADIEGAKIISTSPIKEA